MKYLIIAALLVAVEISIGYMVLPEQGLGVLALLAVVVITWGYAIYLVYKDPKEASARSIEAALQEELYAEAKAKPASKLDYAIGYSAAAGGLLWAALSFPLFGLALVVLVKVAVILWAMSILGSIQSSNY